MYSMQDLEREIDERIDTLKTAGRATIAASWLAQSIIEGHAQIEGADTDFYRCCAYRAVREAVRRAVNRYAPAASVEADPQIVLPGFERLQAYYLTARRGDQTMVHVDAMTDAELEAKSVELRAMGAGCFQHAQELDRYRSDRRKRS